MVVTNNALQKIVYGLGSDISSDYISYFAVGSGTTAASSTDTTLEHEWTRFEQTGSPNFDTARKVTFTGDINTVNASGLILSEFGLLASGPSFLGSIWTHDVVGSVTFDGTNELKIEVALEVL